MSDMSIISAILVVVVAFLAGLEGILDQWQFHQPIIACSLIGIVTGHASAGIILGGSLQLIALGWANVGAAVAPDAALASIASSILMVQSNNFDLTHIMGTIVDVYKRQPKNIARLPINFTYFPKLLLGIIFRL